MTRSLLLWVLILTASLMSSESHGPQFEEGKHYEVVRPVRLHTVRKRDAEHHRPDALAYAMTVGGQDIEMQLERNNELLTKDYSETHYREDGSRVTAVPKDIDHCYYHGRIVNDTESSVSISTCDGLRGYFRTSAQRYLIEPLSGDDEGAHAVRTFNEKNFTPSVCGVTNTSWSDDFEPSASRSLSRSAGISIVQQQKYIELFLVADNREYVKMNKDQTKLRQRIFEIVNFVNMAYKPLKTFVALVGLEIWSNRDMISVTPPAGDSLNAFMAWRNSELMGRQKHDNAQLISGIDFEGATVGLAFVGTLCSGHSVGVVQDHTNQAIGVGATLAHELGHNLGMNHDDSSACFCTGDTCIMSAVLSYPVPQTFSSCSSSNYEKYLRDRRPSCILEKPDYMNIVTPAVCGNGFKEKGEECDCGSVEECTNPCCNATTCTLKEGSQCAEGECCSDCKISPTSSVCRRKQDDCDLAEYCDGKSTACPEDVFAVNGLPCDGGLGYCYNGQCPQRSNQCVKLYGSGASEASQSCYNENTRGSYLGFCKRPANDQYTACRRADVLCGKLFCQDGNNEPNYGQVITVEGCKAAYFFDYTADYGQVDTGTKCGDGKVCSQNRCVDLQTAYRNTNCSEKCSGHAVCNHRSECQCEPGWLSPYCTSKDPAFSLFNEGIVAIAVVVTLVILGIVAAAVGIIWKRSPTLVTALKRRKEPAAENFRSPPQRPPPSQPMSFGQAGRPMPSRSPPPPPQVGNKPMLKGPSPPPPPLGNKPMLKGPSPPPPPLGNKPMLKGPSPPPPPLGNKPMLKGPSPPPPQVGNKPMLKGPSPPPPQVGNKPMLKGPSPPPPPAGSSPKPPVQNYMAALQALRPVPPKV